MRASDLGTELTSLIERQVESLGFECVEILSSPDGGRRLLRITVDAPGGILLDQCAEVSRQLGSLLEDRQELMRGYLLEVSSPGVNRRLTKPEHFERFTGQCVKIRLEEDGEGPKSLTGVIRHIEEGLLTVETTVGDQKIALAHIASARLHVDLDALLKKKRS